MTRTAVSEQVIVSAQVPAPVKAELERLALEGDRSLSSEIRRALARHLERATIDRQEATAR